MEPSVLDVDLNMVMIWHSIHGLLSQEMNMPVITVDASLSCLADDRRRWTTIAVDASVVVAPNDARASR